MKIYEIIEDVDGNLYTSVWDDQEKAEAEFERIFNSVCEDDDLEEDPMDDFFHEVDDCIDEGMAVFHGGEHRIFFLKKELNMR